MSDPVIKRFQPHKFFACGGPLFLIKEMSDPVKNCECQGVSEFGGRLKFRGRIIECYILMTIALLKRRQATKRARATFQKNPNRFFFWKKPAALKVFSAPMRGKLKENLKTSIFNQENQKKWKNLEQEIPGKSKIMARKK